MPRIAPQPFNKNSIKGSTTSIHADRNAGRDQPSGKDQARKLTPLITLDEALERLVSPALTKITNILMTLKQAGMSILFITHRIDDVVGVARFLPKRALWNLRPFFTCLCQNV